MVKEITVGNRKISQDSPVFIIAEAGTNHSCRMDWARRMVEEAARAGVDAIKFQTYKAERLTTSYAQRYWRTTAGSSQIEYYKRLDKFGKKEYRELFALARKRNIVPFSTPFDFESVELLEDLGVELYKIASCDILHSRLLSQVAKKNKPIILSTGASTIEEIQRAIDTISSAGNKKLMLAYCVLSYPAENKDANLLSIRHFQKLFPDMLIGFSDHTVADTHLIIPTAAVALGARFIEKHFTLDRTIQDGGHSFSVDPPLLKTMVQNIRLAELAMGRPKIDILESEKPARNQQRRSLVANCFIPRGTMITEEMVGVKRPGTGLSPDLIDKVVGRITKCNIQEDAQISFEQLEQNQR